MKFLFSIILWAQAFLIYAQSGNFFLSHYSPSKDRLDNICFQVKQDKKGIMYFGTRGGVLEFDGKVWDRVKGSGAVYTIQIADDGRIFWGGAYGYGVVGKNDKGERVLSSLSNATTDIFQSLLSGSTIYFLNEEKIFVFNYNNQETIEIKAPADAGAFTGIFDVSGLTIVNTSGGKTFAIDGAALVSPPALLASLPPLAFSSSQKGKTLIGSTRNEIFVGSDKKAFRKISLEDQSYLNDAVVTSGSWVNDDLVVLGTLRGGLIFVNLTNGKTHEIIDYSTGLPDNEIFTITTDAAQCVWAAHEYGFTRVAPYLPFRSFSHYPGLEGNLLCAITYKNSVYVGTSVGLYKLEKEEVFSERSYYVETSRRTESKPETKVATPVTAKDQDEESKKRGFFRLFRKKNNAEVTTTEEKTERPRATRSRTKRVLRTEKVLVSTSYRYKKVKNIDAKVVQVHAFNEKLIACGLGGTYEVDNVTAKLILPEPTRHVFGSKKGHLFISTYEDEVKTLLPNGNGWTSTDLLKNLNDQINNIFEGHRGDLWLCALDKVYRLQLENQALTDLKVISISNPNYDEFVGAQVEDGIILVNSDGLYRFNERSGSFQLQDSLAEGKFLSYFSRDGGLWFRDEHGWNVMGEGSGTKDLALLNLFHNVRFINPDARSENLWVITNNNELYKYYSDRLNLYTGSFPLVVKSVRNGDRVFRGEANLRIDQDNSSLAVEVVQPDYLAAEAVEYRYHLAGLDQEWTDWSKANNVIEIPYLPSGDFTLEVESRNIFGKVATMNVLHLDVRPPYWKTPWFYALEVIVFSLFVILSFRLSTRYRIISRLLMLLTIIMLIQFVETIIGETLATKTSPVIDFLIQVTIAMLVLPVEGYLRELMLRSLDTNHRFYRFIAPKTSSSQEPDDV